MQKKIIKGVYNWTFLAIFIAAVIIVNIISSLLYGRIDMTEDQRYALSSGTIEYLENKDNFPNRVNIKIYLDGKLPAELSRFRNAVEDKLKEFKNYAGRRIEYEFIDPNQGTDEEKEELYQEIYADRKGVLPMEVRYVKDGSESQMLLWPGAIIEYGGSTAGSVQLLPGTTEGNPANLNQIGDGIQNSINNLEYMLVAAIKRSTQTKKPRIAFLSGHGELKYQETLRIRSLMSPFYTIADIELNDSVEALKDVDGLIIARPTKPFSDKDLYLIDQFVMKGGKLMCFLDKLELNQDSLYANGEVHTTRYDLKLDRMLFDYGLKINDNYIIDTRCVMKKVPFAEQTMIPWFFNVLATSTNHPISAKVDPVSMEYSNEIQFVGHKETILLTPILTSSTNSTTTGMAPLVNLAFPLTYGENPQLAPNPENEANKRCLAGLAEGSFTSHFKNRIVDEYANNPDAGFLTESRAEGKVLLIGNGRFIANHYDSMPNERGGYLYRPILFNELQFNKDLYQMQIPHFLGNQEFFQNTIDYMMGVNAFFIEIRSRQIDVHRINPEKVKADATFYKVTNIGLPIVLILILAFVMNMIRKRKYAK